ncbi:MAG: class I SAM-dependent methyltransferase [Cytophagales bacterium]
MESNSASDNISIFVNDLSLWSAHFGLKLLDIIKFSAINPKILDIGTGLGFPAIELAMRFGEDAEVFGIDPWLEGLEFARQKASLLNIQNVKFLKQYAENMSFDDQYFDIIVSNIGLNNVQNLDMTLLECARVAKKGAQFVFTVNSPQTMAEFYQLFEKVLILDSRNEDLALVKANMSSKIKGKIEIEEKLLKSGFKVVGCNENVFSMRFANGVSFLKHHFIWQVFYPVWYSAVNDSVRKQLFEKLAFEIDQNARANGGFKITIPFYVFDCLRM